MTDVSDLTAAIDAQALTEDLATLVRCASVGGAERAALEALATIATRLGLQAELRDEDLDGLRGEPGYPGEEVERHELQTLTISLPGSDPTAPRLAFNGHVDVVPIGAAQWDEAPFGAVVRDGRMHGRGAADMKGGLTAAVHALAAVRNVRGRARGDLVVQAVAGEEDGGVGAFAALRRDSNFAACVIPEPTDGALVCATAGALTWRMRITGRAAHASDRLAGVSALDRYLPVHAALAELETRINRGRDHPLMRKLDLPYPLVVGRLTVGDWSSTVPDELVCEGRLGVAVGTQLAQARAQFEQVVRRAADDGLGPAPEVTWSGGQFAPAEIPTGHPLVTLLQESIASVTGQSAPVVGVPYGTDMRQYAAYGIPTVVYGPGSIKQAHAVNESVALDEVVEAARVLARVADSFTA